MNESPADAAETAVPLRAVGAGATLSAGSQVLTAAATGGMGIVVARALGPIDTGRFNVLFAALTLLGLLCSGGIEVGVAYRVAARRWQAGEALRQCQLAAGALGLAGAGIGLAVGDVAGATVFDRIGLGVLALTLAGLPFLVSWTCSAVVGLAADRYEAYSAIAALQALAGLALIAAAAPPFGLTGAIAALTLSHLLASSGALAWGLRAFGSAPTGWLARAWAQLRAAAGFGFTASLSNTLQQLNYRADLFLLNSIAAGAVVGQYAVALSVTTAGVLLPRALAAVILPRVSSLGAVGSVHRQDAMALRSVRHAVLLAGGTTALLAAALPLVPLVYGSGFGPAVGYGYLLLPGVAALGVGTVLASVVLGRGRARYSLYNAALVTPPTLLLYALLIPGLGATGAALASTASYTASTLVWWIFFRRVTGMRGLRVIRPGRRELGDYRALGERALARRRRRRAAGTPSSTPPG